MKINPTNNPVIESLDIAGIAAIAGCSERHAAAVIDHDWENWQDHLDWLQSASVEEIGNWIAALDAAERS
jgi:hypothetical protein